jgi:UDP-2,3-diacylglucosamine pyrophosphatase LpxH
MRVVLLSDAHLRGPDDPNQTRLLAFLAGLRADRLCLLGDIFQCWWHFGARPFDAYVPVVEALRAGPPVTFVPGNHDFHAARFFRTELGAEVASSLDVTWDGLRVHLAHGDGADASPGYALSTAVLRGRPFALLVDALGHDRAWAFLRGIAGEPHGVPSETLVMAQRMEAQLHIGRGVDLVVRGHTHAPELTRVDGGCFVNLGDWVSHHTYLVVHDGRIALERA